ncbi:MAG TPA: translocation/assembly module TamB domain-containing protein, partial [Usitatibacter sp.]
MNATLAGTRAAHRLDVDATMPRDTRVRASFQGGLDAKSPALSWNGRVESLAMTGRGAFALVAPATLSLGASKAELGDATLRGEWGEAHLAVTRWTPRALDVKGATSGLQIQNLARSFRLGTVPRSDLVIAGHWDIHSAETFEGTIDVKRVSGDLRLGEPPLPLGLTDLTVHAEASQGRARATVNATGERVGRLSGEGSGLIVRGDSGWEFARSSPVEGKVVASIPDLEALAAWLGPDAKLGGRLDANVAISGTGADPRFDGQARAASLVVREPQSGFEIAEGEVALRLEGRKLSIERFVAKTPWRASPEALERIRRGEIPPAGGNITAEGSIDLAARHGAIVIKADKVPVTQLPKRFVAVSGEAKLEAGAKGLDATGAFKVDAGWIGALAEALPSPSEDVVVIRASQPPALDEPAKKEPMRLDLKIALNDRLSFQGRGLDTRLTGDVRITGEVGSTLRATGVIRTTGGTYEGYGQKLVIERGVLSFSGPLDNPQLNVLALRKGLPVEAGVEIVGTTTRPRVRLVSSPDVPEPEKLSWLVLGRGASDSAP